MSHFKSCGLWTLTLPLTIHETLKMALTLPLTIHEPLKMALTLSRTIHETLKMALTAALFNAVILVVVSE